MKIGSQEQVTGLGRAWAPFGAYFRRPEGWWREGPTHHTAQVFSCAHGWGQPQVVDESTSFWRRARILWAGSIPIYAVRDLLPSEAGSRCRGWTLTVALNLK